MVEVHGTGAYRNTPLRSCPDVNGMVAAVLGREVTRYPAGNSRTDKMYRPMTLAERRI